MSFADVFLPELDHEMGNTRRILELVTDELLPWKAHESLHSIGWVASHIADTLSWTELIVTASSFEVAPIGEPPHQSPQLDTRAEILATFDANLATARSVVVTANDEQLSQPWSLLQGGAEIFTMPKMAVLKTFLINHLVHHRAFLIAYLRMNGIASPGMYD